MHLFDRHQYVMDPFTLGEYESDDEEQMVSAVHGPPGVSPPVAGAITEVSVGSRA
jgi:hypothetical protein